MVKKAFVAVAAAVALFLAAAALQPAEFHVTRSVTIYAPPSKVFEQVNDFRNWEAWNPFLKHDPEAKVEYAGPPAGVGASYRWSGNNRVGEGVSTIVESRPNKIVRIRLEFIRPFKAENMADFTFEDKNGNTEVAWSLYGKRTFLSKAVGLVISMEKTVGGEFEKGLASLKAVTETLSNAVV